MVTKKVTKKTTTRARAKKLTRMERAKVWYHNFKATKVGAVTLSALRAFLGVFIAAETRLFDALSHLVNGQTSFSLVLSLLGSLAAAGVIAAIRAVQLFFFDEPAAKTAAKLSRTK